MASFHALPLFLLLLHLASARAATLRVAPGEDLGRCLGDPEVTRCVLLPGVHRGAILQPSSAPPRTRPLEVQGYGDATVISGTTPVAASGWELWKGSVYRTKIAHEGQVEQAFVDTDVLLTEARWPNLRPGRGPLDLGSWATTTAGTNLRNGTIVATDARVPAAPVNLTGAVAMLNVGYRFQTWSRRVLASSFAPAPRPRGGGGGGGGGEAAGGTLRFTYNSN